LDAPNLSRTGRDGQFIIGGAGLGHPFHLDPYRNHLRLDLLHDVGEANRLLRKLLSLLGQILGMRRSQEEIRIRPLRREKGRGAETSDGGRQ
jgi:hypothetical protein